MNKYQEIVKQEALTYYEAGVCESEIAVTLSILKSTVYKWIKKRNNNVPNLANSYLRRRENKIKCLDGIIEILQSVDCMVNSPIGDKLVALERLH